MEENNKKEFRIADLNKAMFKVALEKNENELHGKVYRFDFEERRPIQIEKKKPDFPNDKIEYYWIEYDENEKKIPQKKLALFFKDVDLNTHNVHVVPGLFEYYELKPKVPEKMPYADVNNGEVIMRNIWNKTIDKLDENGNKILKKGKILAEQLIYPSFAEHCRYGWWCPCPQNERIPVSGRRIIDKPNNTDKPIIVTKKFDYQTECEDADASIKYPFLGKFLKNEKDIMDPILKEAGINDDGTGGATTERYNPIYWYNIDGNKYSIYLTKPMYFLGYGFFTQYHCVDVEENCGKDIIIKCPLITPDTEEFEALSLDDANPEEIKKEFDKFMKKYGQDKNDGFDEEDV